MYNIAVLSWGMPVETLSIDPRITCGSLSTPYVKDYQSTQNRVNNPIFSPFIPTTYPPLLSTAIFAISPLMNTIFTQFPQHLLLLQRNKFKERS
jgi:glutamate mutase epsilon subunit